MLVREMIEAGKATRQIELISGQVANMYNDNFIYAGSALCLVCSTIHLVGSALG